MALDRELKKEFKEAQRKYIIHVRFYGLTNIRRSRRGKKRFPCKRLKRFADKQYLVHGRQYKPYQIEWILANDQYRKIHAKMLKG